MINFCIILDSKDIKTLIEALICMKNRAKDQLTALSRNRNTEAERALFMEEIKCCEEAQSKLEQGVTKR